VFSPTSPLEVADENFCTILGESGAGITTLLRVIAVGFEQATFGRLWIWWRTIRRACPPLQAPVIRLPRLRALLLDDWRPTLLTPCALPEFPRKNCGRDERGACDGKHDRGTRRRRRQKDFRGTATRLLWREPGIIRPNLLLLDETDVSRRLDANLRRQIQMNGKPCTPSLDWRSVRPSSRKRPRSKKRMVMSDRIGGCSKVGRLDSKVATEGALEDFTAVPETHLMMAQL